ncbi:hypothetical protein QTN47_15010 [Danxiaibacter flavus]|uniref:Uncharacterized protein n=1 Tax=Danxiaibacter flavus TaxID=3049108 RepID=A0ABV3ZH52_9BACT|nr:hypothetical protein QNM32_15020 [Chitinophagaceae bacterium DXS]
MEKKTVKLLLLLTASAAISFIFYLQGAKLELKEADISKAKTDSFRIALNYKDSLIHFLRDSFHSNKNTASATTPQNPPVIINNIPSQQPGNKSQIPIAFYDSIAGLTESIGKYLSSLPSPNISRVLPTKNIDTLWLLKLKKIYNDSLNTKLNVLCNNAIGIALTRSRKDTSQTLGIIKSLVTEINNDLIKNEHFISDATNIVIDENKSITDKTNSNTISIFYKIYMDDPLRQKLESLNQFLLITDSRIDITSLIVKLKDLCSIKNGYYTYFK